MIFIISKSYIEILFSHKNKMQTYIYNNVN